MPTVYGIIAQNLAKHVPEQAVVAPALSWRDGLDDILKHSNDLFRSLNNVRLSLEMSVFWQ